MKANEMLRSRIWCEEPEANNPFAARIARCHGYDVYGEMLGHARWVEMLFLLFRAEAPSAREADLLETLAVSLANPGPRDPSVHAAMCGGTCGSPAASALMAALAVGAGKLGGGREVHAAMEIWRACGTDLGLWRERLGTPPGEGASVWPACEHAPGFDPHGATTALPVRQTLACLAQKSPRAALPWLAAHGDAIEAAAGCPLALSGVAAAAFIDLGFAPDEGEMLHLLLRLPGAAAHALEQKRYGHKRFPFFDLEFSREGEAA